MCLVVFCEVGLVSERVRRGRYFVRTFSTGSGNCRYEFGVVGLLSGRVRRDRFLSERVVRGRVSVGMSSARSS